MSKYKCEIYIELTPEEHQLLIQYAREQNQYFDKTCEKILKAWCVSYPITKSLMEKLQNDPSKN